MSDRATLRVAVAEFLETNPESIEAGSLLRHARLHGSAGRGILAAAIHRKLGLYSNKVLSAKTYGELEAALFGSASEAGTTPVETSSVPQGKPRATSPSQAHGLRIGVDVEMVENMPEVADFWTADFYRSHFSPAEIAYCLRQDLPRVHFAARWCAKEALSKCDDTFADTDPATIQVAHRPNGQPVLELLKDHGAELINCAVSLSHTPLMAVAVVVSSSTDEPLQLREGSPAVPA